MFSAICLFSAEDSFFAAEAVADGGIPIAEVTMTTPGAIGAILRLMQSKPDLIVGAGTIANIEMARRCLDAGAKFPTSPGFDIPLVEFAVQNEAVVFPRTLIPSEIYGRGANYINALKSPFSGVRLIASGGVTQRKVVDFILAGAAGVGIGRNPEAVQRRA